MIDVSWFTGVHLIVTLTWTCVGVVLFMNFYSTTLHVFFIFHQSVPYVIREVFFYIYKSSLLWLIPQGLEKKHTHV